MEGRPLIPRAPGGRSRLSLVATTLLLVQQAAAQNQQNQPGNPTSLNGFQFTDTIKFALAGGGGGLILLIVAIVIFCCCRKRRKKRNLPEAKSPTMLTFPQAQEEPKPAKVSTEPTLPTTTNTQTATFDTSPHYRAPSDRLPQAQPTYNRPTPAPPEPTYGGGGYGSLANYGFGGQQPSQMGNVAERRGADPPPRLRTGNNNTPQPPLPSAPGGPPRGGNGRGGWAAVNQAQAWGMHGRHVDNHGRYFGSMAAQGAPLPPGGARGGANGMPPPVRNNVPPSTGYRRPLAKYANSDPYAQGGYGGGGGGEGYGGRGGNQYGSPPAQQGRGYQGGNPYQQRPSPPGGARGGYGGGPRPSPPGNRGGGGGGGGYGGYGNAYASNRDRYAQPSNNTRAYTPQADAYGYGDYGAGRYGHNRDGSEESDQNYYQGRRPAAANQYV